MVSLSSILLSLCQTAIFVKDCTKKNCTKKPKKTKMQENSLGWGVVIFAVTMLAKKAVCVNLDIVWLGFHWAVMLRVPIYYWQKSWLKVFFWKFCLLIFWCKTMGFQTMCKVRLAFRGDISYFIQMCVDVMYLIWIIWIIYEHTVRCIFDIEWSVL